MNRYLKFKKFLHRNKVYKWIYGLVILVALIALGNYGFIALLAGFAWVNAYIKRRVK